MDQHILTIDQGTTSTRAIVFTPGGDVIASHQEETQQIFPTPGWVEQDPQEIWQNTLKCCHAVLANKKDVAAIGITNQRETTILWERDTGKAIYPAIIWQDRRTADICGSWQALPISEKITEKTGLIIDPYFSASKIAWLLANIPDARQRCERGEILFGTIDTFLLWHLTEGRVHATDATNASRTLLFNIHTQEWDEEILAAFAIPREILPRVLNTADDFGVTKLFGKDIPICAMVGDQQAALIGQACFEKGMGKITYGTGAFVVINTASEIIHSKNKLLATVAYRIKNITTYALEGSIFSAGSILKWMRDSLKIITSSAEADELAETIFDNDGVYLVPAFTGLGAPYWKPNARAAIVGMSSDTSKAHFARAALEAVCYQTKDLLECVKKENFELLSVRVDGGMSVSDWMLKFLASLLELNVERPREVESTALGAMYLACLQCGILTSLGDIRANWRGDKIFMPSGEQKYISYYEGWLKAIEQVIN